MNQSKKMCWLMIVFGLIILTIGFMFNRVGKSNVFIEFIIVMITFSISVFIKVIANQYMSLKQYNLLNTLAVSYIFKGMLIMFLFHSIKFGGVEKIQVWTLIFQCNLLEITSLIFAYFLSKKEIKASISTYLIPICFFIIMLVPTYMNPIRIQKELFYTMRIGVIIIIVMMTKEKEFIQSVLNEKNAYFGILSGVTLLKYIFGCLFYKQWQQYSTTIVIFQFLQMLYLFHCAFYTCLHSPWQQRMSALTEADEMIQEQAQNCDMIVNLSHELKTPVNVIRSALDILVLDINDSLKEEVRRVKRECNEVMNIIQDMIDIQKINTHHIEVNIQNYNLVELLENVIEAFAKEIQEAQLIFNPQEEEINNQIDGLLIEQCFMLLIGMLLEYDKTQEIYIEMDQNMEKHEIYVKVVCESISYLKRIDERLKHIDKEELKEQVAQLLTLKLIYTILEAQDIRLYFSTNKTKNELYIIFDMKQDGKRTWLDERTVAILNDQIRCRYIAG